MTNQPAQFSLFLNRYSYDSIKVGSKTGETLMAIDEETMQSVVVKRPGLTQPNPDLLKSSQADLLREEKALKALGSLGASTPAALCRLVDSGDFVDHELKLRYLVLEHARGTPVPELVDQYRQAGQLLPERLVLEITTQLLDVLAAAHRLGIVYNDVKPDHLYWEDARAQLKVIDWGNAIFMAEDAKALPAEDVFQVGELLYYLIEDAIYTPPVPGALRENREWVNFTQHLQPGLKRIITRSLNPDPALRYENAGALQRDLSEYRSSRRSGLAEAQLEIKQALVAPNREKLEHAFQRLEEINSFDAADPQSQKLKQDLEAAWSAANRQQQLKGIVILLSEGEWLESQQDLQKFANEPEARFWSDFANSVILEGRGMSPEARRDFERRAAAVVKYMLQGPQKLNEILAVLENQGSQPASPDNRLLGFACEYFNSAILVSTLGKIYRLLRVENRLVEDRLTSLRKDEEKRPLARYLGNLAGYLEELETLPARRRAEAVDELANQYQEMKAKFAQWRAYFTADAAAFSKNLATNKRAEILQALQELDGQLDQMALLLTEIHQAIEGGKKERVEPYLVRACAIDPHNGELREVVNRAQSQVVFALNYPERLPAGASAQQVGEWLATSQAEIDAALRKNPRNSELSAQQQGLRGLNQDWSILQRALNEANPPEARKALANLRSQAAHAGLGGLEAVVDGFFGMMLQKPWRFTQTQGFVTRLEALIEALENGIIDRGLVEALSAAARQAASLNKEKAWVEYFARLLDAQAILGQGDPFGARNQFIGLQNSPLKDRHFDTLQRACDLVQIIQNGEITRAREEYERGLKLDLGSHTPLGSMIQSHLEALPRLQESLKAFVADPLKEKAFVQNLPIFFERNTNLRPVILAAGLTAKAADEAFAGRLDDAHGTMQIARSKIVYARPFLNVAIADSAARYDQYLAWLNTARKSLEDILSQVGRSQRLGEMPNLAMVQSNLDGILDFIKFIPGHNNEEACRPLYWKNAYGRVAGLVRNPLKGEDDILLEIDAWNILPEEPIYPLFEALKKARQVGREAPLEIAPLSPTPRALQPPSRQGSSATPAEKTGVESSYQDQLARASALLAEGNLPEAAKIIEKYDRSVLREKDKTRRWEALRYREQVLECIYNGNEAKADSVWGEYLRNHPGDSNEIHANVLRQALVRLPEFKNALEDFNRKPLQFKAAERLQGFLPSYEPFLKIQLAVGSLEVGFDFARRLDYDQACERFYQAAQYLKGASPCLGVNLNKGIEKVSACHTACSEIKIQLKKIQDHALDCRRKNTRVSGSLVNEAVNKMIERLPEGGAELFPGPRLWQDCVNQVNSVYQAGGGAEDIQRALDGLGVNERDPLFPLYLWVMDYTRAEQRKRMSPANESGETLRLAAETAESLATGNINVAYKNLQNFPQPGPRKDFLITAYNAVTHLQKNEIDQASHEASRLQPVDEHERRVKTAIQQGLEQYSEAQTALREFFKNPLHAAGGLQQIAPVLHSEEVKVARSLAVRAGQALTAWQAGDYAAAALAIEEAQRLNRLAKVLGVPAREIKDSLEKIHKDLEECLNTSRWLLNLARDNRSQRATIDWDAVEKGLKRLSQLTPAGANARPQIWLRAFDELLKNKKQGVPREVARRKLEQEQIGPTDPLYELFQWLLEAAAPKDRRWQIFLPILLGVVALGILLSVMIPLVNRNKQNKLAQSAAEASAETAAKVEKAAKSTADAQKEVEKQNKNSTATVQAASEAQGTQTAQETQVAYQATQEALEKSNSSESAFTELCQEYTAEEMTGMDWSAVKKLIEDEQVSEFLDQTCTEASTSFGKSLYNQAYALLTSNVKSAVSQDPTATNQDMDEHMDQLAEWSQVLKIGDTQNLKILGKCVELIQKDKTDQAVDLIDEYGEQAVGEICGFYTGVAYDIAEKYSQTTGYLYIADDGNLHLNTSAADTKNNEFENDIVINFQENVGINSILGPGTNWVERVKKIELGLEVEEAGFKSDFFLAVKSKEGNEDVLLLRFRLQESGLWKPTVYRASNLTFPARHNQSFQDKPLCPKAAAPTEDLDLTKLTTIAIEIIEKRLNFLVNGKVFCSPEEEIAPAQIGMVIRTQNKYKPLHLYLSKFIITLGAK